MLDSMEGMLLSQNSYHYKYVTIRSQPCFLLLYSRWGGGKSTLWKQIIKCLHAEFLEDDTQELYNVEQLSNESHPLFKKAVYREAGENAKTPFNNAVKRLLLDPYTSNVTRKTWEAARDKDELLTAPLTFLEHLACLFINFRCCFCQSCAGEDELDNDDSQVNDDYIQRIQTKSQDARSRHMEMNAIFFLAFLFSLSPIWIVYWPIYFLVSTNMLNWYSLFSFITCVLKMNDLVLWGDDTTQTCSKENNDANKVSIPCVLFSVSKHYDLRFLLVLFNI